MLLEIQDNCYLNIANLATYHPQSGNIKLISQNNINLSAEDNAEFMQNFLAMKSYLPGFIYGPRIVINLAFVERISIGTNKADEEVVTVHLLNKTYYDLSNEDAKAVLKVLAKDKPRIISPHN